LPDSRREMAGSTASCNECTNRTPRKHVENVAAVILVPQTRHGTDERFLPSSTRKEVVGIGITGGSCQSGYRMLQQVKTSPTYARPTLRSRPVLRRRRREGRSDRRCPPADNPAPAVSVRGFWLACPLATLLCRQSMHVDGSYHSGMPAHSDSGHGAGRGIPAMGRSNGLLLTGARGLIANSAGRFTLELLPAAATCSSWTDMTLHDYH
jgi:hypothetical protein